MSEAQDLGERVVVHSDRSLQRCNDYALVLTALDIPCWVVSASGGYAVLVHEDDLDAARRLIALYAHENANLPGPTRVHAPALSSGLPGALAYSLVLIAVDLLRGLRAFSLDWWGAGVMNAGLVQSGEWWRCVTALTLHADAAHLAGNILFGSFFGLLASQPLGSGLAWLCILLAGALGNGLNAALQPASHTAIGASTAVFAALGMVCVHAWLARRRVGQTGWLRWGPIIGGIVLLAFLGVQGERTDVAAHVTGFLMGCLLGVVLSPVGTVVGPGRRAQKLFAWAAVGLLAGAWIAALLTHG